MTDFKVMAMMMADRCKQISFMSVWIALFCAHGSYAQEMVGVGYGDSREKAVQLAYVDLAQQLFVRVESTTEVRQSYEGSSFSQRSISETDIPLLQVPVSCEVTSKEYECHAVFDSEAARPRYQSALTQSEIGLRDDYVRYQSASADAKYPAGKALATALNNYQKLRRVAGFLGLGSEFNHRDIASVVEKWQSSARFNVSSLRAAAALIVDDVSGESVSVAPPFTPDSQELTPFGRAFLKELETQLGARLKKQAPRYKLLGSYMVNDKGMDLSYELVDLQGNSTVQVKQIHLLPEAYSIYETEPSSIDFDQLLRKGLAISGDFSVAVATNKGMRNLAFEAGDSLELLVKLNRPGYFYVVGYSAENGRDIQYLLPVSYGSGREQFVQYVSAEQVNRWVSLGEFEVSPPFGTERLQVFASEDTPVDNLPLHFYDATSGYFLIGEQKTNQVRSDRTRGLKKIRKAAKAKAESFLVFSTYE